MSDPSQTFNQATLWDIPNAISSPESAGGVTPCASPNGPTTSQCGPAHAPANPSAKPGKAKVKTTRATYGRISFASSPSQDLCDALANRLRDQMDLDGSPEYTLTWKRSRIASGLQISALQAKARPISGNGCTGWPTPKTPTGGPENGARKKELGRMESGGGEIASVAMLAGWSTPRAEDAESSGMRHARGVADTLTAQTWLAGWNTPTSMDTNRGDYTRDQGNPSTPRLSNKGLAGYPSPAARDYKGANLKPYSARGGGKKGEQLPNFMQHVFGMDTTSSTASTEKRGALKPEHSRWLMGYPPAWDDCGVTAMQLCRKQRRGSSERT